ncbi:hypothetical protein PLESTB_001229000 [Pleodorina starrii]|uniref:Uncharacterized protein n=1 Tax=Pleodorina starrii TaxID=330485 RepID=A0A9W6BT80_9CHLO|nr:hypothetical protein PLESTB_001229000 [Pleodorina starrii]GLC77616.1 hypothetical protein PLESTF_001963700 [Pleodorina starrii]
MVTAMPLQVEFGSSYGVRQLPEAPSAPLPPEAPSAPAQAPLPPAQPQLRPTVVGVPSYAMAPLLCAAGGADAWLACVLWPHAGVRHPHHVCRCGAGTVGRDGRLLIVIAGYGTQERNGNDRASAWSIRRKFRQSNRGPCPSHGASRCGAGCQPRVAAPQAAVPLPPRSPAAPPSRGNTTSEAGPRLCPWPCPASDGDGARGGGGGRCTSSAEVLFLLPAAYASLPDGAAAAALGAVLRGAGGGIGNGQARDAGCRDASSR